MKLFKGMFFLEPVMIILEGYFEYLITAFLAMEKGYDNIDHDGIIIMITILFMCLVVAPLAFFY